MGRSMMINDYVVPEDCSVKKIIAHSIHFSYTPTHAPWDQNNEIRLTSRVDPNVLWFIQRSGLLWEGTVSSYSTPNTYYCVAVGYYANKGVLLGELLYWYLSRGMDAVVRNAGNRGYLEYPYNRYLTWGEL